MRRYMWPNSCLPSATVLIDAAYDASKGRFTLEGVENHAPRTYPSFAHPDWMMSVSSQCRRRRAHPQITHARCEHGTAA